MNEKVRKNTAEKIRLEEEMQRRDEEEEQVQQREEQWKQHDEEEMRREEELGKEKGEQSQRHEEDAEEKLPAAVVPGEAAGVEAPENEPTKENDPVAVPTQEHIPPVAVENIRPTRPSHRDSLFVPASGKGWRKKMVQERQEKASKNLISCRRRLDVFDDESEDDDSDDFGRASLDNMMSGDNLHTHFYPPAENDHFDGLCTPPSPVSDNDL